jgi:pimeloyl-ACP methyl ester carboxylesterase
VGPADATPKPRPTILVSIRYDGGQEVFHAFGFAALERGYNVMTYEGLGQGSVRRYQGVGFTHAWEKVVSPVVDHLVGRSDVDSAYLALIGWSLGGYLCVRAAAFEHRLAAALAIDGVYDFYPVAYYILPPALRAAYDAGDASQVNNLIEEALTGDKLPTKARWAIEHRLWSFAAKNTADFLKMTELMTLEGVIDRVKCPVLVGEAADDMFFKGQPALVAADLGDRATHLVLIAEDAASPHCHVGALSFANHIFYDWLEDVFSSQKTEKE